MCRRQRQVIVVGLFAVVGDVQSRNGQYCPHDVLVLQANLYDVDPIVVTKAHVIGQGGVRVRRELVEQLEVGHVQTSAI